MKKEIIMKRYQEINEKIETLLKQCTETKSYIENELSGEAKIGFKYLYDNQMKNIFKAFDTTHVTLRMIFTLEEKDYSNALKELNTISEIIRDTSRVIHTPMEDLTKIISEMKEDKKEDSESIERALNKLFDKAIKREKEKSKS